MGTSLSTRPSAQLKLTPYHNRSSHLRPSHLWFHWLAFVMVTSWQGKPDPHGWPDRDNHSANLNDNPRDNLLFIALSLTVTAFHQLIFWFSKGGRLFITSPSSFRTRAIYFFSRSPIILFLGVPPHWCFSSYWTPSAPTTESQIDITLSFLNSKSFATWYTTYTLFGNFLLSTEIPQ